MSDRTDNILERIAAALEARVVAPTQDTADLVDLLRDEPTATEKVSYPQCPRCKQFHAAEDPQMTWRRVLETTPPDGQVWRCPCCPSWASLSENAHAHGAVTGHGFPLLASAPAAEKRAGPWVAAAVLHTREDDRLRDAVVDAALAWFSAGEDLGPGQKQESMMTAIVALRAHRAKKGGA